MRRPDRRWSWEQETATDAEQSPVQIAGCSIIYPEVQNADVSVTSEDLGSPWGLLLSRGRTALLNIERHATKIWPPENSDVRASQR